MHSVHTQVGEMTDSPGLGESQEFAWVFGAHALNGNLWVKIDVAGNREITVVHLIDYMVFEIYCRSNVLSPLCRVGLGQVDNGTTAAVHTHCLSKDAWILAHILTIIFHVKSIELALEVALHLAGPLIFTSLYALEVNLLEHIAVLASIVDAHGYGLRVIVGVQEARSGLGSIGHLVEIIVASTCSCHSQCDDYC